MRTEEIVDEDGSKSVYIYDDQNNQLRTTDYDDAGNIVWDIHYDIDAFCETKGWRIYDSEGQLFKRFEREQDARGREVTRQYRSDGTLEHTFIS
jgi:uncharacterized protein RhaS with RHS repeats